MTDDIDLNDGAVAPSCPTGAEVTDFDASSATLRWREPAEDGGLAVNGFYVEYRKAKVEEEWTEWMEKIRPKKHNGVQVTGLDTGGKYEFRVFASNRAGRSDPSEPTPPQVIKAQKAPPQILRKCLGEDGVVKCKTNQQLILDVTVEGAPPPETSWWRKDEQVTSDDTLKVSHSPNMAKLSFFKPKRTLAGKYTLKAKNAHGEDTAEVEIKIIGKPSPPRGPLVASEVTKKSCVLSWNPVEDDGGYPILNYEVEKLDPSMDQWLPCGRGKGTSLQVNSLSEGKSYKFLVRAVTKEGDSPDLLMSEPITAKNPYDPPSQPGQPEVCDWGPDFADLRWDTPERDGGAEIESYRVEARNKDRRGWTVVGSSSESDVVISEGIEQGCEYEFRVVAVNRAGESEQSRSSKSMVAKSRFVKPKIDKGPLLGEKTVRANQQALRISTEVSGEPMPKLSWWNPAGAKIENSEDSVIEEDGNRITIVMKKLESKDSGMYKLKARNSEGSDEAEVKVTVIGPPSKPQGPLEASSITSNGCTLSWTRSESDGGSPIKAYTVEKKHVERDNWVPSGQIAGKPAAVMKQLEYEVTGLLEGEVYMFRVIAVNAQGESEPLDCFVPVCASPARPVPLAPSAPRIKGKDRTWVKLEWTLPADSPAVTHYIVEQQEQFLVPKVEEEEEEQVEESEEGEEDTKLAPRPVLKTGPSFSGEFQDYTSKWMTAIVTDDNENWIKITGLQENHNYTYRVKAVNSAGMSDPSEPSKEVSNKGKQRPVIDRRTVEPVKVSKGENINIQVKFSGDPVPERSWHYGKIAIKQSHSVLIQDKDHTSKLTLLNAKRDDTGQYEFRVENEFGQETALVDVTVSVEPSRPRGPMKIDNVTANGCTCSWQEPEDDGGSPVTHYVIEKITNTTSGTVCGRSNTTSATLSDLVPDKEHRLQVRAVNAEGQSDPLPGVDSFITENPFGAPTAPGRPEMVDGDVDHFVMAWDPPRNDGGSRITGYQLQARKWKENNYFDAGEVRMQIQKGEVTKVELGQVYAVRVRAVNAAGPGSWSMDSEQLTVKHRALKPRVTISGSKQVTAKVGEGLNLEVDIESEPPSSDVTFSLNSTDIVNDHNSSITIKPYKAFLRIQELTRKHSGSLTCTALNRHGSGSASVALKVQGPPSVPSGLLEVSNINKNGCTLTWGPSQDDGGLQVEYLVEKKGEFEDKWKRHGSTSKTMMVIGDMEHRKEYHVRVRAANAVGESEALEASKGVLAKEQFSQPLPPGVPEITDWSERQMDIKWTEPLDLGGCPLQGYHIEARLNSTGDWQLWETLTGTETVATLQMLNKGTEYQFRVLAVNKAGKSEPSHPSRPREARAKNLPPSIDDRYLQKELKCVAGDRVKFDLPFQGEPTPSITWTKEGCDSPVETNRAKDVSVTNSATNTKLVFNNIAKDQEGEYTLTVENSSGKEAVTVKVIVRGKPSIPESLSSVLEGNKCQLSWRRPQDDGGANIDYYQIERFDSEKPGWLACGRSKETRFEAVGLMVGHQYRFKVTAVNRYGDSEGVETKEAVAVGAEEEVSGARGT